MSALGARVAKNSTAQERKRSAIKIELDSEMEVLD